MSKQASILGQESMPEINPSSEEKVLGLFAHLITFLSSFIGPLIIYLLKREESSFVAKHAKESLNFQITVTLVSLFLIFSVVGLLVVWLVGIFALIFVIVATVRASEGKLYRYPLTIRFIR